jgi:hypothetical protein
MLQLILGFYSTNVNKVLGILDESIECEKSNNQPQTCIALL